MPAWVQTWLPLVAAVAAVGLIYLCCLRPMLRNARRRIYDETSPKTRLKP